MKPTLFCVLQSRVILRTPLRPPFLTLSQRRFPSRLHCKDPPTEELNDKVNEKAKESVDEDLASSRRVAIITGAASIGIGVLYLLAVQLLDSRDLQPPPPEAYE